ncbi:MAG: hypothetical protein HOO94_01610 [Novosphingobium sp.]|nr:hypothetical protein [Novosphingobium sp.]
MLTAALPLLFLAAALLAVGTIAVALRRALPQVAGLRAEVAACSDRREVRFRVVETVVRVADGKVVALPVRPRPVRSVLLPGLRVAA